MTLCFHEVVYTVSGAGRAQSLTSASPPPRSLLLQPCSNNIEYAQNLQTMLFLYIQLVHFLFAIFLDIQILILLMPFY